MGQAIPGAQSMTDVVLLTVALSIVAHGMTAAWGARRYAAWFEQASGKHPDMPEAAEVSSPGVYLREAPHEAVPPSRGEPMP